MQKYGLPAIAGIILIAASFAVRNTATEPQPSATPIVIKTATPLPTSTAAPAPIPYTTPTWTPVPGGAQTLRAAASKRNFAIGAAVFTGYLFSEPDYMNTLGREFNMVTPEIEMKFEIIQPDRGQFNYEPAEQIVTYAQANQMAVRGHVLVWHVALPDWFVNGSFSRDETIQILHDHISAVVGHFRGRVKTWDVVNEAVFDEGGLRQSPWLERIGPDYIEMAFRFAREADPDALLFYNDYGIDDENPKSTQVYEMLRDLKAKGVPIDGVGFQMHIRADTPPRPSSVRTNMLRFANLGLQVYITEMDVSTMYTAGSLDTQLLTQAYVYRTVLDTCLSVAACKALVVWGVTDKYTWLHKFYGPSDRPLLFDDQYRPKPAYQALEEALRAIGRR